MTRFIQQALILNKETVFLQKISNKLEMSTNRTFTMIKPDGVENGHIGGILNMITEGGFKIISLKLTPLCINRSL